jgi:hypothetical protein
MRHNEDFANYERERKKARRLAKEAYVHFRVMYDQLSAMPAKAADATIVNVDEVEQCLGDLEHVAEYLPLGPMP